ncbi:MAG TPA: hypothetical protein VGH50_13190, partial [Candidatus Binatia bacterium]
MRTRLALLAYLVLFIAAAAEAAAPAPKAVITFGGLNERTGVLFVAKDAGLFAKYGLDAQVVHVRSGPVGMSALASGETQFHA